MNEFTHIELNEKKFGDSHVNWSTHSHDIGPVVLKQTGPPDLIKVGHLNWLLEHKNKEL